MSKHTKLGFVYATTNHPSGRTLEGVVIVENVSVQTVDDIQKKIAADIARQYPSGVQGVTYQVLLFTLQGFPLAGGKSSQRTTLEAAGLVSSGKVYVRALLHRPGIISSKFPCFFFIVLAFASQQK